MCVKYSAVSVSVPFRLTASPRGEYSHRGVHLATLLPVNGGDGPLLLSVSMEQGRVWGEGEGLH